MIPILGLVAGILLGIFLPYNIPDAYSMYVAVGILAALDSVFGGTVSVLQGRFDLKIFLSGFFGNAFLAVLLAFVGDQMGIPLYMAAIFAFGNRLFDNFAVMRRLWLAKYSSKGKKSLE